MGSVQKVAKKVEGGAKKVGNVVGKAADQTGNAIEGGVRDTRNEAFRNLGKDGQKYAQKASDVFVENSMHRMGKASEDTINGNIGDATRAIYLEATGVSQTKDHLKAIQELAKNASPDLVVPVDDPSKVGPVGDPVAEAEAAAKALKEDANMQEQLNSSRKRGRASTILTGPQGLSGSNAYSSKKTLLGA